MVFLPLDCQGFAMGFGDTGGNVGMIRLHKEHVGPYLQALHFSFGVGAFISPGKKFKEVSNPCKQYLEK